MRKRFTNIHEATEKARPDVVRRVNEHISIAVVYAETEAHTSTLNTCCNCITHAVALLTLIDTLI